MVRAARGRRWAGGQDSLSCGVQRIRIFVAELIVQDTYRESDKQIKLFLLVQNFPKLRFTVIFSAMLPLRAARPIWVVFCQPCLNVPAEHNIIRDFRSS